MVRRLKCTRLPFFYTNCLISLVAKKYCGRTIVFTMGFWQYGAEWFVYSYGTPIKLHIRY